MTQFVTWRKDGYVYGTVQGEQNTGGGYSKPNGTTVAVLPSDYSQLPPWECWVRLHGNPLTSWDDNLEPMLKLFPLKILLKELNR